MQAQEKAGRKRIAFAWTALVVIVGTCAAAAQVPTANSVVPRLVNYAGVAKDADGKPVKGLIGATFAVYAEQEGGAPLWVETQNITASANGSFAVMLGLSKSGGLPQDVFSSGQARWLGISYNGGAEQARVALLSVPYALKAGDAQTLGGLPASAFALAVPPGQVAAPAVAGNAPSSLTPSLSGSGTADFVPLWLNSTGTLGNSVLFQSGSGSTAKLGVNTSTPSVTLDIKGATNVRGTLLLPAMNSANASAGFNSNPLKFTASSYNSSSAKAVTEGFQWQAEPSGNNSSSPSATLNLLFGAGATPSETGLKINSQGRFTFASGQTFPGTGTITGVTAGTDLTGGGSSGNITLSLDATKIPQLNSNNSFSGNESISGNVAATGTVSGGLGNFSGNSSNSILNVTQNSTSGPGFAVVGSSYNAKRFQAAVLGQELAPYGTAEVFGAEGFVFGPSGAGVYGQNNGQSSLGSATSGGAGVWGDTAAPNTSGVLGTADNNNAMVAENNSKVSAGILAENQNTSLGVVAPAIVGFSFAPNGMAVVGSGPVHSKMFNNALSDIFQAYGVVGDSVSGTGVGGYTDSGLSVSGFTDSGTGVFGSSNSNYGVYGVSTTGTGVYAQSTGGGSALSALASDGGSALSVFADGGGLGISVTTDTGWPLTVANTGNATTTAEFDQANHLGAVIWAFGPSAGGSTPSCVIWATGDLHCTGSQSSVVPLPNKRLVSLYAVQSPENWFEDFGSGQLREGSATIALEPTFAETVSTGDEYHIFLTPNGDSLGLYVAAKTAKSFEVREHGSGKSTISFDYRIVARRKGYESIRMEDVTEAHADGIAAMERSAMLAKQRPRAPLAVTPNAVGRVAPPIQMPILQRQGPPSGSVMLPVRSSSQPAPSSLKH